MKPLNFIVPLEIYPFDIMFSIGESDKAFSKAITDRITERDANIFLEDEYLFNFSSTSLGRTVHNLVGGQTIIRFKSRPTHDVVSHEIFHAIDFIFSRIGLKLTPESNEAYAYAIQYVTKEFYKRVNLKT